MSNESTHPEIEIEEPGADASGAAAGDGSPGDPGDGNGQTPPPPAPPAGDGKAEPAKLPGPARLKPLENTNGHYVVLWARKPKRGHRAAYEEIGFLEASGPDAAKSKVMEQRTPAEDRSETARFLWDRAGEGGGILLRAVPAMHWPAEIDPTTFVRPEPILTIG